MAANKLPGIRAALCHDVYSAHQCVEHDNANIFCLGAQIVGDRLALDLLDAYLNAEFSTEEHFRAAGPQAGPDGAGRRATGARG